MAALYLYLAVIKSELPPKPEAVNSDLSLTAGFKCFATSKEGAPLPVPALVLHQARKLSNKAPEPAVSDLSLTAGFKRFAASKEGVPLPAPCLSQPTAS